MPDTCPTGLESALSQTRYHYGRSLNVTPRIPLPAKADRPGRPEKSLLPQSAKDPDDLTEAMTPAGNPQPTWAWIIEASPASPSRQRRLFTGVLSLLARCPKNVLKNWPFLHTRLAT